MKNNIFNRLIGSFIVIIILMIGLGIFALNQLNTINQDTLRIAENTVPSIVMVGQIRLAINSYRREQLQHVVDTGHNEMSENESTLDNLESEVSRLFEEYNSKYAVSEEATNFLIRTKVNWQKYLDITKPFRMLSRNLDKQNAVMVLNGANGENDKFFDDLLASLTQWRTFEVEETNQIVADAQAVYSAAQQLIIVVLIAAILLACVVGYFLARSISQPITKMVGVVTRIAAGDLEQLVEVSSSDEIGVLGNAFNAMMVNLRKVTADNQAQLWLSGGQAKLNDVMRGEQDMATLSNNVISFLCEYLQAQVGTLSVMQEDLTLHLMGSYAYLKRKNISNIFKVGEGLIGQAAREKKAIIATSVPADYVTVNSSLGEVSPANLLVAPFIYENRVIGVLEVGSLTELDPKKVTFIERAMENIAIAFYTTQSRLRLNELLIQSQRQAEELKTQEEELRSSNEELSAQTEELKVSEQRLKEQQLQLENTNAALEEQAAELERNSMILTEKQEMVDKQNRELMVTKRELEQRAEELALASKYKSEFLANMSHELRTPLNSLLILASMLVQNSKGNLSEEEVESVRIIYSGGQDLLNLINEILDLSKIEAGRMEFRIEPVALQDIVETMTQQFNHVAETKELAFNITLAEGLPREIETDQQRVKQIIKNLLSNAFKFTSKGQVTLELYQPTTLPKQAALSLPPSELVAMRVTDTGIGIKPEQQKIIFEAFQQADGGTSRQYGGTGLGLSISRELALKLGGFIEVESEFGQGSRFTLYLPLHHRNEEIKAEMKSPVTRQQPKTVIIEPITPLKLPVLPPMQDDRETIVAGDRVLLIIEDDVKFAKIVYDQLHQRGFKGLVAGNGETGLQLATRYQPNGIILDLHLPDISGWQVLGMLKENAETRHIPIHVMSVDDENLEAYKRGAIGYLTKPVTQAQLDGSFGKIEQFISQKIKHLLLVEDDATLRLSVKKLLSSNEVTISEAGTGSAALELLRTQHFDCMILDLSLPDMTGFEVLNQLSEDDSASKCPVIVYTGREITKEENIELMKYTSNVIVKGVKSPERLLDETALFLHQVVADMPEDKQNMIKQLHEQESILVNKRVLIVDDDARNSFALSKLLADKGMKVRMARDGQKALEMLASNPQVDLILMDIMMPILDGYETMRQIRAQKQFQNLPILALTAKAMKGDREKCLEAGANDYLTKPIDPGQLFSMMRVWLYQ